MVEPKNPLEQPNQLQCNVYISAQSSGALPIRLPVNRFFRYAALRCPSLPLVAVLRPVAATERWAGRLARLAERAVWRFVRRAHAHAEAVTRLLAS